MVDGNKLRKGDFIFNRTDEGVSRWEVLEIRQSKKRGHGDIVILFYENEGPLKTYVATFYELFGGWYYTKNEALVNYLNFLKDRTEIIKRIVENGHCLPEPPNPNQ